jgi:hypothetical protein
MATLSFELIVNSPPSTGIIFTPAAPVTGSGSSFSESGQIPAGTTIGTLSVSPAGWQGILALTGAQASSFTLSGMNVIASSVLAVGTYDLAITATP